MAASNTTIALPNPYTPMAFLPPTLADKVTYQAYSAVGSLAFLMWDIILHIPQDYKLATQFRINCSFIIYCIARVTTLAYVFGLVLMTTAPIGHCDLLRHIRVLSPLAIPLSVLPFVMRVSALYSNNKYVVAFFSTSWIFVLGTHILVTIETFGGNIGTTKYCLVHKAKLASVLTPTSIFIHDTLVFVATSWGFMRNSYSDVNVENGIRVMIFGRHLPTFSKSILRDGQAYYLATLILNFLFVVLGYIPSAPITPCAMAFPLLAMLNNMSSHVYRNLRFGFYRDPSVTSSMIDNALQRANQTHHQPEGHA